MSDDARRAALSEAVERYLQELDRRFGPSTDADQFEAEQWADRIIRGK